MAIQSGIDLLDRQYEHLRAEIVQAVNMRHLAVLGMFTIIAGTIGALLSQGDDLGMIAASGFMPYLVLVFAFLLNAFGTIFLKEQARNRRCTALNQEIERIITRLASRKSAADGNRKWPGFLAWENFIRSDAAERHNRLYYQSRDFGVGLPILLFTIPAAIALQLFLPPFGNCPNTWFPPVACALFGWTFVVSIAAFLIVSFEMEEPPNAPGEHGDHIRKRDRIRFMTSKQVYRFFYGTAEERSPLAMGATNEQKAERKRAIEAGRAIKRKKVRQQLGFLYVLPAVTLALLALAIDTAAPHRTIAQPEVGIGQMDHSVGPVTVHNEGAVVVQLGNGTDDRANLGDEDPARTRFLLALGNLLLLLLGLRAWHTFCCISRWLAGVDVPGIREWIRQYLKDSCHLSEDKIERMLDE